jgi:hypothetical protein
MAVVLKKDGVTSGKAVITFSLKNVEAIPEFDGTLSIPQTPQLSSPFMGTTRPHLAASPTSPQYAIPNTYVVDENEQIQRIRHSADRLPMMPCTGTVSDDDFLIASPNMAAPMSPNSRVELSSSVAFDPRMLSVSETQNQLAQSLKHFDFHVNIGEVEVWDLLPAHSFIMKNSPFVSAACGKWTTSTTVIFNQSQPTLL